MYISPLGALPPLSKSFLGEAFDICLRDCLYCDDFSIKKTLNMVLEFKKFIKVFRIEFKW
jgi:hypothetical protein